MTYWPVIVSCDYRWRTRARTVVSLARHDIRPFLIRTRCAPAAPRTLRVAGITAMRAALTAGRDLLWLEDDVTVNAHLPAALDLAQQQEHPVVLCNIEAQCEPEHVSQAVDAGAPMPLHVAHLVNVMQWAGSQAVYIPRVAMPFLLANRHVLTDRPHVAFDVALRNAYSEAGLPLVSVFPNPVQHMNEPSARKVTRGERLRLVRTSRTFDWPQG